MDTISLKASPNYSKNNNLSNNRSIYNEKDLNYPAKLWTMSRLKMPQFKLDDQAENGY